MLRIGGDRNWWTHGPDNSNAQLERHEDMALVYTALGRGMRHSLENMPLGQIIVDVRIWQNPDYYADYPAFIDLYVGLRTAAADDAFQAIDVRGSYQQVYPRSDQRNSEPMFRISYHVSGLMYGPLPSRAAAYVLLPIELDGEILRPCCVCDRWEDGVLMRTTWGSASAPRFR